MVVVMKQKGPGQKVAGEEAFNQRPVLMQSVSDAAL